MALFRKDKKKEEPKPMFEKKPASPKTPSAKKAAAGDSAFGQMVASLGELSTEDAIKACTTMNPKVFKKIPPRARLIALGFNQRMTLDELNEKLMQAGFDKLYSRNFTEAGLIQAFSKQMTFEAWSELRKECREEVPDEVMTSGLMSGKDLTPNTIKAYLHSYLKEFDVFHEWETQTHTRKMEKEIIEMSDDKHEFIFYMRDNLMRFSKVREKARHYYCKYLYAFLLTRINAYVEMKRSGEQNDDCLMGLTVLKGITQLRRENMSHEAAENLLMDSRISCGAIYDAFNYFYFEYTSIDWMEVLLEYYGDPAKLPAKDRASLCRSIRIYKPDWKEFSDEELIKKMVEEQEELDELLDSIHGLDGEDRGYQRNRSGENSVRNYLTGKLDIDRTTLICYLIFFDRCINHNLDGVKEMKLLAIDESSLSVILEECGFGPLDKENDFDGFILGYLDSDSPEDYLIESATEYALNHQNFFLYHMYNSSVSIASLEDKTLPF